MTWLALDIGGANIKLADGRGYAASWPFELWKAPEKLAPRLAEALAAAPAAERLAITMTGELCDCFATKAEGVAAILDAVEQSAGPRSVHVYLTDGRLAQCTDACEHWRLAAASNWHALASFAGRFAQSGGALLVDIGSTTTDLIPLVNGRPAARGVDDTTRLAAGELVYTGVDRTPVCAAVRELPYRGQTLPVAAELFATTGDAHLWLGLAPEAPQVCDTADGRPRSRDWARARLARTICADRTNFTDDDAKTASQAIRDAQILDIAGAAARILDSLTIPPKTVILSGQGEALGRLVVEKLSRDLHRRFEEASLREKLGREVSQCAPAHALAVLAREGGMEPRVP